MIRELPRCRNIVEPESDNAYRARLRDHFPEMSADMIASLPTAHGYGLDLIGQYCRCQRGLTWTTKPEYPRARMLLRVRLKGRAGPPVKANEILLARPYEGPNGWRFTTVFPPPVDPAYYVIPITHADAARKALTAAGPWRG